MSGCLHCGYCSGVWLEHEPEEWQLERQFNSPWRRNREREFTLMSSSFLTTALSSMMREFSPAFRQRLFRKLKAMNDVARVLVETRPEYVEKEKILSLLAELRTDQELEVGVGLETADDFIRAACLRKGFERTEFEKSDRLPRVD